MYQLFTHKIQIWRCSCLKKKDIVCIMINTYSIIDQASGSKTENLNKYSSISFSVSCFKALNLKKKKSILVSNNNIIVSVWFRHLHKKGKIFGWRSEGLHQGGIWY